MGVREVDQEHKFVFRVKGTAHWYEKKTLIFSDQFPPNNYEVPTEQKQCPTPWAQTPALLLGDSAEQWLRGLPESDPRSYPH